MNKQEQPPSADHSIRLAASFEPYDAFPPAIPVWCITPPGLDRCIHRFFDTNPLSPSGRYAALTRLPSEERTPGLGEAAEVIVVDLQQGTWEAVARTYGYDTQLGAQAQWGRNDHELYFNDMDLAGWRPHAVRLDPLSGQCTNLDGPLYMVSPDGSHLASPCLQRTACTQGGYGVLTPAASLPLNSRAADDDGLYITATDSGAATLLVSYRQLFDSLPALRKDAEGKPGALYGFHVKWNPQGTRLMFVVRFRLAPGKARVTGRFTLNYVVTMRADGSDLHLAMPAELWARGGHHPNWCPDGEHIIHNLNLEGNGLVFVRYRYDGSGLHNFVPGIPGGGHPTLHPDGRHILTDAYLHEPEAFNDGTTPLRWIDCRDGTETTLVRIRTQPLTGGPDGLLRVDPHPAWDRTFRRFVFNACPQGRRQVFLAEADSLLAG